VNDKDKADKPCPPGLEKKNGCVPAGHAKANDTRAMGNSKATRRSPQVIEGGPLYRA